MDDISGAIEDVANSYKLGIVRQYGGHGVGHSMHEDPFYLITEWVTILLLNQEWLLRLNQC